jgi:hypothetical protein
MIWIVIVFLVVAVISLITAIGSKTGDRIDYFFSGVTFSFSIMIAVSAFVEFLSPSITPMDVYQGKTTLEYKVVDGEKIDSTVVWKNKEEQL